MNSKRILIIDDEVEIAQLVSIHLQNEGFDTLMAHDGKSGLELFEKQPFDLVILDIMMPKLNGHEVLTHIRKTNLTPVIFLSAKQSDLDKISGLVIGADDYITKPFNPLELVARVNAQLRRAFQWTQTIDAGSKEVIRLQNIAINADERTVCVNDQKIELTPKEFDILWLLMKSPNQVFSSEQLFKKVWKENYFEGANTVMVHIRTLRKKIQDTNKSKKLIETVWGVGYKFNA
ncbi:response regulator transcription factor [Exiguobacterium sp. SL-10]|uniref:response regulator transcription factor n=1 Tax=Exiguobacterium sp. SL-10 TaxID=2510962 RepID=UPI00103EEE99|nr:response regulator transcription factor [Exiguobacterium sp. SL-10]TCI30257.1 response regulator transcription factor [Exiguobacterium sp. SL-10]